MDKRNIRKELRTRLAALDASSLQIKSSLVCENAIRAVDWTNVRTISCYTYIESLYEVDPSALIAQLHLLKQSPKVDFVSQDPRSIRPTKQYDVIIVPLLGFDTSCNRIGRGGGWYDRFLATQDSALTIGLAYNKQCIELIPVEPHDIRLDMICDEDSIYRKGMR